MNDPSARHRLRIVALADSLAMARKTEADRLRWEQAWPYLLDEALRASGIDAEVVNRGVRARTADTLVTNFYEDTELTEPDVVVLQVGVVDGAPRIFSRREHGILNIRGIRRIRHWIIARRVARRPEILARNPLAKVYTPPKQFAAYLREFHRKLMESGRKIRTLVLPALYNKAFTEKKSPGFDSNMTLYNRMLEEFCRETGSVYVKPDSILSEEATQAAYCSDGYHLNEQGSRAVADAVLRAISGVLESP